MFHMIEFVFSVVLVLAVERQHRELLREAQSKLEIKRFTGERVAMTDLLTLVCDAVVELDDEMKITEHSPKLATMLLLDNSSCIAGMQLHHFMPIEGDRERLEAHLGDHELAADTGPPILSLSGAFHATMRDSMSSRLQVEIFFVRFLSVSGRRHHLVGIREFMDQPLAELKKFRQQPCCPHDTDNTQLQDSVTINAGQGVQANQVEDDVSSIPSSRRSGSTRSAGKRLVLGKFLPTTTKAKALTLIASVQQWNFEVTSRSCCPFHAAVRDMWKCCDRLRRSRCKHDFLPEADVQCKFCGILSEDDSAGGPPAACEVCGSEGAMSIRPQPKVVVASL
mmetsp:Transcript_41897/g.105313  ORF Transcript_41897/g.105313 Transcript_41897/m.105313 type:complete len:337 (+) Transcript_41897:2-1012(+)